VLSCELGKLEHDQRLPIHTKMLMLRRPLMWTIPRKNYNAGIKVIESYINPSIQHAMSLAASGDAKFNKSAEVKNNTLLHALASYTTSPKVVRDQLTSVLFAGSDTTASAMTWVLFELSRNPHVISKLQGVITSTLGTADHDRIPTFTELKSMKYLTNVINETLRLYATMPFATRQALRDTTLPRGGGPDGQSPIAVLKDTPVLYSALLMHRRRDLYPPISATFADPRVWSPERWDVWQPKSWQLIPFSGGARICIGQNFALAEMAYTVVRLLQNFERIDDFNPRGKEDPVLRYGIVATAEEGVKVAFVKKNGIEEEKVSAAAAVFPEKLVKFEGIAGDSV
jgi:cytochrome P450